MKNIINFFYNLYPETVNNYHNNYYFLYNNKLYILILYDGNINDINNIYELNQKMISFNIKVHQIILNKDLTPLSFINNNYYILYNITINNFNKKITLQDINYLNSFTPTLSNEILYKDWSILWANKIDYLEYQINQSGKKYPILVESFSYFVGMSENAISYFRNTVHEIKPNNNDIGVISHKKIKMNDNLFNLYDPTNLIIDYKVRDIAEYIKNSFFVDNFNIIEELYQHFSKNYYSEISIRILLSRIIYPSYYFQIYDSIIKEEIKEEEILKITSRIDDYELYLYEIFSILKKIYNIPEISWLKKRRFNLPH